MKTVSLRRYPSLCIDGWCWLRRTAGKVMRDSRTVDLSLRSTTFLAEDIRSNKLMREKLGSS